MGPAVNQSQQEPNDGTASQLSQQNVPTRTSSRTKKSLSARLDQAIAKAAPFKKLQDFSRGNLDKLLGSTEVQFDLTKLHATLREAHPTFPALNHMGGIPGFLLSVGLGDRYLRLIRDELRRSVGNIASVSERLHLAGPVLHKTYEALCLKLEGTEGAKIGDFVLEPGGLTERLSAELSRETVLQVVSKHELASDGLLATLGSSFRSGPIQPSEVQTEIQRWITERNWPVREVQKELAPLFPFCGTKNFSFAHLFWGLGIGDVFLRKIDTLRQTVPGITDGDLAEMHGWTRKSGGQEYRKLEDDLRALAVRTGIETNVPLNTSLTPDESSMVSAEDFRVQQMLGLSDEEDAHLPELLDQSNWDLVAFLKSRGVYGRMSRVGFENIFRTDKHRAALKTKLTDLWIHYNGTKSRIAEHLGCGNSSMVTILAERAHLDLRSIPFHSGYLLDSIPVDREDLIFTLKKKGLRAVRDLLVQASHDPKSSLSLNEQDVTYAQLVWGTRLQDELSDLVTSLRENGVRSMTGLGKAVGIPSRENQILEGILERLNPVSALEVDPALVRLDQDALAMSPADLNDQGLAEMRSAYERVFNLKSCWIAKDFLPHHLRTIAGSIEGRDPKSSELVGTSHFFFISRHLPLSFSAPETIFEQRLQNIVRRSRSGGHFPECFWIEIGQGMSAGGHLVPTTYIATIDVEAKCVDSITRLQQFRKDQLHNESVRLNPDSELARTLFSSAELRGLHTRGQAPALDNLFEARMAMLTKRAELYHSYDESFRHKQVRRFAKGLVPNLIACTETFGADKNYMSTLDLPFLFGGAEWQEIFASAKLLPEEQIACRDLVKSITRSKHLRAALGANRQAIGPLEMFEYRLENSFSDELLQLTQNFAGLLLEVEQEVGIESAVQGARAAHSSGSAAILNRLEGMLAEGQEMEAAPTLFRALFSTDVDDLLKLTRILECTRRYLEQEATPKLDGEAAVDFVIRGDELKLTARFSRTQTALLHEVSGDIFGKLLSDWSSSELEYRLALARYEESEDSDSYERILGKLEALGVTKDDLPTFGIVSPPPESPTLRGVEALVEEIAAVGPDTSEAVALLEELAELEPTHPLATLHQTIERLGAQLSELSDQLMRREISDLSSFEKALERLRSEATSIESEQLTSEIEQLRDSFNAARGDLLLDGLRTQIAAHRFKSVAEFNPARIKVTRKLVGLLDSGVLPESERWRLSSEAGGTAGEFQDYLHFVPEAHRASSLLALGRPGRGNAEKKVFKKTQEALEAIRGRAPSEREGRSSQAIERTIAAAEERLAAVADEAVRESISNRRFIRESFELFTDVKQKIGFLEQ